MTGEKEPERAAVYQIQVEGELDDKWSDWFDGLSITHSGNGTSHLTGIIVDQAALHGVLAKLGELGLPILMLRQIRDEA